jgi:hypothetical protein
LLRPPFTPRTEARSDKELFRTGAGRLLDEIGIIQASSAMERRQRSATPESP